MQNIFSDQPDFTVKHLAPKEYLFILVVDLQDYTVSQHETPADYLILANKIIQPFPMKPMQNRQ